MRLTIYTAIFGDYDILKEPLYTNRSIRYICFSDIERKSKIWDVRIVERTEPTPRRDARKYKILSHKYIDTGVSLWIDGSCTIKRNPTAYIEQLVNRGNLFGISHKRNCIYVEAEKCINTQKGDPDKIRKQIEKYKTEVYPENNGLINTRVLLRKMSPEIIKLENDWWDEVVNGSCRDQISFNYAAWKNNLKYGFLNWRTFVSGGGHMGKILLRQKKQPIPRLTRRRGRRKK